MMTMDDLRHAFDWVNADPSFQTAAYVDRDTGDLYLTSDDMGVEEDEPLPDDLEDGSRYLAVPHKNDLDLGRALVFEFVEDRLPDAERTVAGYFRSRGAYGRFKDLLDRRDLLQDWYAFEADRVGQALRQWAQDNKLPLDTAQMPPPFG